jgi:hypothetical protein
MRILGHSNSLENYSMAWEILELLPGSGVLMLPPNDVSVLTVFLSGFAENEKSEVPPFLVPV